MGEPPPCLPQDGSVRRAEARAGPGFDAAQGIAEILLGRAGEPGARLFVLGENEQQWVGDARQRPLG